MKRIVLALKSILSHFPTKLPVGMNEFNAWADSVIELSGKFADDDSLRFALASMVIHADAKHGSFPKAKFVAQLRKSAANQVASQVFQDIKVKQAEAAKQAEATALLDRATANGTTETQVN